MRNCQSETDVQVGKGVKLEKVAKLRIVKHNTQVAFNATNKVAMDNTLIHSASDKGVNMLVAANCVVIVSVELFVISFDTDIVHLKMKISAGNIMKIIATRIRE